MQGVSQGQQRAYGAEANKTASRIQLYMTLALFLWIMREQWQMVPIILCCVTALQHKCSFPTSCSPHSLLRCLPRVLGQLVATMLAFLGALWYNQRSLIYMPNMPPESRCVLCSRAVVPLFRP